MKKLLLLAHTPSDNTQILCQALANGVKAAGVQLNFEVIAPLNAQASDLEHVDGLIFLTTENFGYMSGALKDLFDRCYYDLVDIKRGLPYALVIRAGKDGTGTKRAVESICAGLGWVKVQEPAIFSGEFTPSFTQHAQDLAQGFAVGLSEGIF